MNKLYNKILKDIQSVFSELISFICIVFFLYGSALFFFGSAYNNTRMNFHNGSRFLLKGLLVNFCSPYVLITIILFVLFYFIIFKFLAKDRAGTFGIDTSKPNYLSAVRDYTAVIFLSAVSCIHVYYPLTGSLLIPVSTLAGIVLAWWAMSVIINIGGFGESVKETVEDLAIVAGIIFAGKTLPAVLGDFAYASPLDYFIEVGIIYVIGPGVGVVAYPGVGITLELSSRKVLAYLQSFAISVFMYFSIPFFAVLPAFLMLVPFLAVIGIAALYFLYTGRMYHFGDFSSDLFYTLIFPRQNNVFLSAVYSPILYFLSFFENLITPAFHHWSGVIDLIAFFSSLHYRLHSYKRRLAIKNG